MAKYFYILLFCLLSISVKALDVSVIISQYYSVQPDLQPYIEVYFHNVASSLSRIKEAQNDSLFENKVKVTLLFMQNDQIIKFDHFIIESGFRKENKDFIALKRYGLQPGKYNLNFTFVDLGDTTNVYKSAAEVNVKDAPKGPFISNLVLVADTSTNLDPSVSKNNLFYGLIPFSYVNASLNRFGIYLESYQTNLLQQEVTNYTVKIFKLAGKNAEKLIGRTTIKRKSAFIDNIFTWFDATYYESGQYKIQVFLNDKDKKAIDSTAYFFTKSNPVRDEALLSSKFADEVEASFIGKMNLDEINYTLRAIAMNVKNSDVELLNRLLKEDNKISKSNFLYNFFKEKSTIFPEDYYKQYMEVAKAVDKKYKTGFGYGFESDRGLIFMKYGKPSDMITVNDDPSSAPYEVWLYYDIPKLAQSNVKFLFYNPFLDGMDYRLLQSNARGEVRNPNWKKELYKTVARNPDNLPPDKYEVPSGFNRHAEEWLQDL